MENNKHQEMIKQELQQILGQVRGEVREEFRVALDQGLTGLEQRLNERMDQKFVTKQTLDQALDQGLADLEQRLNDRMDQKFATKEELARMEAKIIRWVVGLLLAQTALLFTILRAF